jgi:hypothetical protein
MSESDDARNHAHEQVTADQRIPESPFQHPLPRDERVGPEARTRFDRHATRARPRQP